MKFTNKEKFIIKELSKIGIVIVISNYIQAVNKKERKILYQVHIDSYNSFLNDLINPLLKEDKLLAKQIKEIKKMSSLTDQSLDNKKYKEILDLWWIFIEEKTGIKPSFNPGLLKKAESIYNRMYEQGFKHEEVINSFKAVLENYDKWDDFEKKALNLAVVENNFHKIISKLKQNGEKRKIGISEIRQRLNNL